jgi:aromatic ring-opening dioxygenase LigB subunit
MSLSTGGQSSTKKRRKGNESYEPRERLSEETTNANERIGTLMIEERPNKGSLISPHDIQIKDAAVVRQYPHQGLNVGHHTDVLGFPRLL